LATRFSGPNIQAKQAQTGRQTTPSKTIKNAANDSTMSIEAIQEF
jgi:hypothetical protein